MTDLQDYCLEVMGITQWQLRQKQYLFLLTETLDEEKNQLLVRLMLAMKWDKALTSIKVIATPVNQDKLKAIISQAQKVVLFGQELSNLVTECRDTLVCIPAVSEMLVHAQAKKKAWQILQKLRT
ncbi:MAG: hypothetical protein JSR17_08390 [Proteobacteria bacterium]|nr:hypothetical protein [Pseudomonadota bacterium]